MSIEWLKIRNDYINGVGSYRELAKKYGMNHSVIARKASAEGWAKKKQENEIKKQARCEQKIIESEAAKEADRISRILTLSDELADRIERAISELDIQLAKNKRKTRVIEYHSDSAPGKPTKETIEEREEILEIKTTVDRLGLQQIANALKAVKEIQTDLEAHSYGAEIEDDPLTKALKEEAEKLNADKQ